MKNNSKNFEEWIKKAENDLMSAKAIFEYYEEPPLDMVCYHCHQTVEKMLKSFLILKKNKLPKIHDLVVLLNQCIQVDEKFRKLEENIQILNKYYIEAKYPADFPIEYSNDEVKDALNMTEEIFSIVNEKLIGGMK